MYIRCRPNTRLQATEVAFFRSLREDKGRRACSLRLPRMPAIPSLLDYSTLCSFWSPSFVRCASSSGSSSRLCLWRVRVVTCTTAALSLVLHKLADGEFQGFRRHLHIFLSWLFSVSSLLCLSFHFCLCVFLLHSGFATLVHSALSVGSLPASFLCRPLAGVLSPGRWSYPSCLHRLFMALTCYFLFVCPVLFVHGIECQPRRRQNVSSSSVAASLRFRKTGGGCIFGIDTPHSVHRARGTTIADMLWTSPRLFLPMADPLFPHESAAVDRYYASVKQSAVCLPALLRTKVFKCKLIAVILSRNITSNGVLLPGLSFPSFLKKTSVWTNNCATGSVLFSGPVPQSLRQLDNGEKPVFSFRNRTRCSTCHAISSRRCCEDAVGSVSSSATSFVCSCRYISFSHRRNSASQGSLPVNNRSYVGSVLSCQLSVLVPPRSGTEKYFPPFKRRSCSENWTGTTFGYSVTSLLHRRTTCFVHLIPGGKEYLGGSLGVPPIVQELSVNGSIVAENIRRIRVSHESAGHQGRKLHRSTKQELSTGGTRLHASLLGRRRRLKLHEAEKVRKALRRGVPLRYLDVSGNVHAPTHMFNPILVLRFDSLLDRFLHYPAFPPLSASEGGSLIRFLSMYAKRRDEESPSSYTATAHQLRRLVSALFCTVHPVLRCMYTRWLRLQEHRSTPAEASAPSTVTDTISSSSYVVPCTSFSPGRPSALAPSHTSSSLFRTAPVHALPRESVPLQLNQHRIIACSKEATHHSSTTPSASRGNPLDGLPMRTAIPSPSTTETSTERLALAIEGGAMRGCVTAGMAAALHYMGFADVFDAVYGSSAGSLVGAYFLARQLPYEGAQVYYDWLPYMGKKFLDMKRLGKDLGLGFLRHADIWGFLRNKKESPPINLDVLLHDLVQRRQPLSWAKFKRQDQKQPLKVIASGLHSQKAIILESASGHFESLSSFLNCLKASMLMPGLTGPVVHVRACRSPSNNVGSNLDTSANSSSSHTTAQSNSTSSYNSVEGNSSISSTSSGISTSIMGPGDTPPSVSSTPAAAETTAKTAASPVAHISCVSGAVAATGATTFSSNSCASASAATSYKGTDSAASNSSSSSFALGPCSSPVANGHSHAGAVAAAAASASEAGASASTAEAGRSSQMFASAADAVDFSSSSCASVSSFSSSVPSSSTESSSSAHAMSSPPLISAVDTAAFVSEPLADALLYEPIPYRSALLQGYNHVLVLRSRPDGKRVGRLSGLEAAIENRMAKRFFGEAQQLRGVFDYVKQRQHRIRYMDDMLLLNEASNNHKLLRVIRDYKEEDQGGGKKKKGQCDQLRQREEMDGQQLQQQGGKETLEGYAFAVSLTSSSSEIAKTTLKRKKILQGIREGFARVYDVLVPDPAKRGRGMEEALKVFPENLPSVTEAIAPSSRGRQPMVEQRVPPAYDSSTETQHMKAGALGEYLLQAALAQNPRLISSSSSIRFASPPHTVPLCGLCNLGTATRHCFNL